MDQRKQDETEGTESAAGEREWTRPEVDRLLAGGAESSSGADIDAADFTS